MIFGPNSAPVADQLLEFNPCHNPEDGRFAVKGQGRCLGVAARRAARLQYERFERDAHDAETESAIAYVTSRQYEYKNDPAEGAAYAKRHRMQAKLSRRQEQQNSAEKRALAKRHSAPIPKFLQKDVADAWKADRVAVLYGDAARDVGLHYPRSRVVHHRPGYDPAYPYNTKPEQLSVLRHELGHADRTELGRGGPIIRGEKFRGQYIEEWRAWKNAIRNSGGKVDFKTVRASLRSYIDDQHISPMAYDYVVDRHVAVLKRYAKRIRRASK